METILGNISSIRSGVTLRGEFLNRNENGNILLIQPRDVANGILIHSPARILVADSRLLNKHLLEEGDLLISNKGLKFTTFLFNAELMKSVASGSFFVIKLDRTKCFPEFLQWYLEQPQIVAYLSENLIKTTIPSLSIGVLNKLSLLVPEPFVQKKILDFLQLVKVEENILKKVVEKTEKHRDSYVWELIKGQE